MKKHLVALALALISCSAIAQNSMNSMNSANSANVGSVAVLSAEQASSEPLRACKEKSGRVWLTNLPCSDKSFAKARETRRWPNAATSSQLPPK